MQRSLSVPDLQSLIFLDVSVYLYEKEKKKKEKNVKRVCVVHQICLSLVVVLTVGLNFYSRNEANRQFMSLICGENL